MVRYIYALTITGMLFLSQGCPAQDAHSMEQSVDSLFADYGLETPGAAVGVIQNGTLTLAKGYGMANLEHNIPITSRTVFHMASVSKQFTAFAIYLLEDMGKLSLEDDIRTYLPEVPDFGQVIQIKHLCNHTSGLRDQWILLAISGWRLDDVIITDHILKMVSSQQSLNFPPGSQFRYSNTGYTLMAEIVKRISGQSFAAFTRDHIFQPLGMDNTQFYDNHEKVVKQRADSYIFREARYDRKKLNYSTVGATSLFTTVEDLVHWINNFKDPIVGTKQMIEHFNAVARLDNEDPAVLTIIDGETIYHAKGQFYRNYRGLNLYNHTGGDAGFKTYLARFPDQDLAVIVLGNYFQFQNFDKGLAIAKIYLEEQLEPKKELGDASNSSSTVPVPPINRQVDLRDLAGDYFSDELKTTYTISVNGKNLLMTHRRMFDVDLEENDAGQFTGSLWFPVTVEFTKNEKGLTDGFVISDTQGRRAENIRFHKWR